MDFFSSTHDSNHISQHVDAFAQAIAARPMNMPPVSVLPSSSSTSAATTPRPAPPTPPSVAAFTAVPPTALDPWLNDPHTLILDIRPSGAYASARVPGAVSLSAPSTLLKRPSVPLQNLSSMLPPRSAKRFSAWPYAKRIMVYDADAAVIAENSSIFGLLRKFQNDGFKGEMAWLRGGFHSVWRERKALVDTDPPTPDAEEDDSAEPPSHQAQAPILRPRLLSSTAFTVSSTLLGNPSHSNSKRGPLTLRGAQPSSSSAHHPAANPFFDTIRQNVELSHGITERIPLQLPRRVRRRLDDLDFVPWLQRIAKLAGRSPPHSHPLPSDASSEDDIDGLSSGDNYGDALANQFFQIELAEQQRLMNVMQYHSQESGVVVEEKNEQQDNARGFPYSITAGVEKGAKNRYRHIWPFEHARVKLQAKDDDYVNASYVQPLFTRKRYIATQGPLPATYADFWTLCWEQNVHVIVMLTREVEGAMEKCGSYWSDHEYGPLRLRLVSTSQTHAPEPEEPTGFFSAQAAVPSRPLPPVSSTPRKASHYNQGATVRRVFELAHTGYESAKPRKIVHLQYLDWPDMNVPDDPRGVLGLIKQVDEAVAEVPREGTLAGATTSPFDPQTGISTQALGRDSPVLLHCSAGVGRTGGFIIVDSILDAIRGELKQRKGRAKALDATNVAPTSQTLSSGHTIHVPVADKQFSAPMDVDVDESEPPPLTEVSETSIDFPRDDFARTDTQKWAEDVGAETSYGKDLAEGSQAPDCAPSSRSSSSEDSSAGRSTPSSIREAHASSSLATSISSGPHTNLDNAPFLGKSTADHYRERTTSAPVSIGLSKKRVPPSLSLGLGQLQPNGASSTPSFSTPSSIQRNPSVTTTLTANPSFPLPSRPFSFSSALQPTTSLPPAPDLVKSARTSPKAPRSLHAEGSPLPLSSSKDPIWDIVQDMREQRMSLCQSLRQYVFVHKAVIEGALMVLDEETGSGSNGDAFASSIDISRIRDRVIPPRTAPSKFSSQPTRSSHSRSSSVSSRRFPSTSPSQRRRKGSSSRCQSPSPTESSSSSRHPIPPLLFQQALSMESLSSAPSSHGKRSASPTELRKEGMQGEVLLSKRPSIKRKRESGHQGRDADESHPGSETVVGNSTLSTHTSSVASANGKNPPQQRMVH